jgi:hypothetical protein
MKKVVKHELIEIIVPAGSTATRFQLPDAQNLREVSTYGIQAYYTEIIPNSIISGYKLIEKLVFTNAYITFENYAGREFIKQAPLPQFQTIENNMVDGDNPASIQEKDFKNLIGQKINFPKSYIETPFPIASATANTVFLLSVYYTDKDETYSQTTFAKKH